ncbi:hypothetical protein CFC21_010779 [Triticum aestivum]|uniref:Cytochrome c domain-containing protein n=3 Tax=Triticum aestivum TaxID=4565 RepID=A0A9R1DM25_WHEAT|nr:hypothetical protein CFC21_010029 [Triticum aestivum]KAF6993972.1 hypothetical protein CFC21_010779 [Triticum aestivum]
MADEHYDESYVDCFINFDAMEEPSMEDLLGARQTRAVAAQHQQDAATLIHQAPPSGDVDAQYLQAPAPPPIQHQQLPYEPYFYGFKDEILMPEPIPQVHPIMQVQDAPSAHMQNHQVPAPMHEHDQYQHVPRDVPHDHQMMGGPSDIMLDESLLHDLMQMLTPTADVHLEVAPSDHVQHLPAPATAVQHQQTLGESSGHHFHGPMPGEASIHMQDHQVTALVPMPLQSQAPAAPSGQEQHLQAPVHQMQHQSSDYSFGDIVLDDSLLQDLMQMPSPMAHDIQAAPADHVQQVQALAPAVQHHHQQMPAESSPQGFHNQMLGESSARRFHAHVPDPASTCGSSRTPMPACQQDILSPRSSGCSSMVHEYLMQNDQVDIAEAPLMSDSGSNGVPSAGLMEDEEGFVPLVPGRLQCSQCHLVRQIRFQCEIPLVHIFLHSATHTSFEDAIRNHNVSTRGTFEHAILDRHHFTVGGQVPRAERMYIDFRRHTGEFVLNFLANIVDALRREKGGTLEDTSETVQRAPARSNIIPGPALRNDTVQQVETTMLNMIINSTAVNAEAAQPAPPPPAAEPELAIEATANTAHEILTPTNIFDSSGVVPEEQPISEAAKLQQEAAARLSEEQEEEEEMRQYLHEMMVKARRELDMPYGPVQKFCRGNTYTWMWRRISTLNRRIINFEEKSLNVTLNGLLTIKTEVDEAVVEKERLLAEIVRGMKKQRESWGKNDREAGTSGTKKAGGASN